jgi:hypothetical protein
MTFAIDQCCGSMGTMIKEGTIEPYTVFGYETTQINARGHKGEIRNYKEIKHCPFCGRKIRILK